MTFSEAAADLDRLVKSRRREQSLREMSDSKDYMEANADDFDRRAEGPRRKDIRATNKEWAGIQALDDDELFALGDELAEESRMMLVSGRRARIRFPGARGDSELRPFDRQRYIEDEDIDEDFPSGSDRIRERNGRIRGALGGDAMSWRAQAKRDGVGEDRYGSSKSFGFRGRFTSADLIKSFGAIKSRLSEAMFDGQLDPVVLMNFDAAGSESRLGFDTNSAARALALVAPGVRKAYGIPTISGNHWEEFGRIRRGA